MKKVLCLLLCILVFTGCAKHYIKEEWATGTIVDLDAKRVSFWAGKVMRWETRYYMTLKLDNYEGEYPVRISESAMVQYLSQDDDNWMGVLCKGYKGDKFVDAYIEDVDIAEEITILGDNEIGTYNPKADEYVTGNVLTTFKVHFEDSSLYTCYAYLHIDNYDGIYRIEVPEEFCDTYYFSDTKSFVATLQKYYRDDVLTKTMVDDIVFTD